MTKRQEAELEVAELKMLRFSLGVTRMDRIRNEYVRGTVQVGQFSHIAREERLRWFGHVQKMDIGYIGKKSAGDGIVWQEKEREAKEKIHDVVREDMEVVGVTGEDVEEGGSGEA